MNRILDRILARLSSWHHAREASRTIKGILAMDARARKEPRR